MRAIISSTLLCAICFVTGDAQALTHIVQPRETLASIAEKYYGKIQHEKILVAANALDAQGGSPIVPGMRLEVPTLSYRRVKPGDTWAKLASELLGAPERAEVLSAANGSRPWLLPEDAAQILVPYNLTLILSTSDNVVNLALKFLGSKEQAWPLDYYNGFKGKQLTRGDVVLIPLTDLELTPLGNQAIAWASGSSSGDTAAETRSVQRRVHSELPALIADVRGGRYTDAITRGNRFLAAGELTTAQVATIHRQLLEAYVAVDAAGLATASCKEWRKHDKRARLDPVQLSPKILSACRRGGS